MRNITLFHIKWGRRGELEEEAIMGHLIILHLTSNMWVKAKEVR